MTIHLHPTAIAHQLKSERLRWMQEAALLHAKGDTYNASYCQGKASGLNAAIVLMGGEGISLRIADYAESGAA